MLPMKRNETDDEIKQRQDEALRQNEANDRAREQSRRLMFNMFQLWRVCPDKRCARARGCRGDAEACLRDRWFVHVSPEARALLAKTLELVGGGMKWQEALDAANADMEHRLKIMADIEARYGPQKRGMPESIARRLYRPPPEQAASAPVVPSPVVRSAPPRRGPRVTRL